MTKNGYVLAVIILSTIFSLSFDDLPPMKKVKAPNGITVLLPEDFSEMDEQDLTQRYPSVRMPVVAYTSPDHDVDFSINESATIWPDADLKLASEFFKASLNNLYDRVDMIDEGISEIKGKQFAFLEFESRISGERAVQGSEESVLNYTYIQYYVLRDKNRARTFVISFNCPRRLMLDWQDTAHYIMQSIRFSK